MIANAIIPCGGVGARTGLKYNKIFYKIFDKEVILHTLTPFLSIDEITRIIVVYNKSDEDKMHELLDGIDKVMLVEGGASRTESVKNGLAVLDDDAEYVIIHDGARPYIDRRLIVATLEAAQRSGGATLYSPITDTIKRVDENMNIIDTPNRNEYVTIETPQTFEVAKIKYAYEHNNENLTDDTQVYEKYFGKVELVLGSRKNKKITSSDDLEENYRVGIGFDTHKLVEGRKLVLGGITVPHTKGLLCHSDADVLTHAIMDSVLSAGGLRDIGVLFPDNDPAFKDIYSINLLERVYEEIDKKGYRVGNISAVLMAEKPKLKDYIPLMIDMIAKTMHTERSNINISATTTEGIGMVGREEGMSAKSICLLIKSNNGEM